MVRSIPTLSSQCRSFKGKQIHFDQLKAAKLTPSIRPRGKIRSWLENNDFEKLLQLLSVSKAQLEALFDEGDLPVLGWLQLAATIDNFDHSLANKEKVDSDLKQNANEREQVVEQIKILRQKLEKLENTNQQLQQIRKTMDDAARLQEKSQLIAMLGKKETASLVRWQKHMENPYFMDVFDSSDISTVFSAFDMDALFPRFQKNDVYNNLGVTGSATVEQLQKSLQMGFSEAVELLWKVTLLKHGEKGVAHHLSTCSICAGKPPSLLREYGMSVAEVREMSSEINGWYGYYLVTINAQTTAEKLNLTDLKSKFILCCLRIQDIHQWEQK